MIILFLFSILMAVSAASDETFNDTSISNIGIMTIDNNAETLRSLLTLKKLIPEMKARFEHQSTDFEDMNDSEIRKFFFDRSQLFEKRSSESSKSISSDSSYDLRSSDNSKYTKYSSESYSYNPKSSSSSEYVPNYSLSSKSNDFSYSKDSISIPSYSYSSISKKSKSESSDTSEYENFKSSESSKSEKSESESSKSENSESSNSDKSKSSDYSNKSSKSKNSKSSKSETSKSSKSEKSKSSESETSKSSESETSKSSKSETSKSSESKKSKSSSPRSSYSVSNHHYERSDSGATDEIHIHHDHTYIQHGAITFNPILTQCCKDILNALDETEEIIDRNINLLLKNQGLLLLDKEKAVNLLNLDNKNKALLTANLNTANTLLNNEASQKILLDDLAKMLLAVFNLATTPVGK